MHAVHAEPAPAFAATISDPLSWEEICERYPDQWVCLVEIDRPDRQQFAFRTARVVGHGTSRREPLRQARAWWDHYREISHYFTGMIVGDALRMFA